MTTLRNLFAGLALSLAVAGPGPGFRLYRCGSWEQIALHDPTAAQPLAIKFHPTEDLLLSVMGGGPVTLRSPVSGDVRFRLEPDPLRPDAGQGR